MSAVTIKLKDELIREIKNKILDIPGSDMGRPVNLDNASSTESCRSSCGGKINITCLFINEDDKLCVDMYRVGSAGCVDFICGMDLDSVNEKILNEIMSALKENRWSVADYPVSEKQKKRNLVSSFKLPFLQKVHDSGDSLTNGKG